MEAVVKQFAILYLWKFVSSRLVVYVLHAFLIELSYSEGLYAQHIAKKPKTMKLSLDNTFDVSTMNGSIPSPAASQMSNPSKFIKIISGRDRGRKVKSLKVVLVWTQMIMC